MSLDKAIQHGKEHRARYRGSAAFDPSCRPGGDCPWCQRTRKHKGERRRPADEREQIKRWASATGAE